MAAPGAPSPAPPLPYNMAAPRVQAPAPSLPQRKFQFKTGGGSEWQLLVSPCSGPVRTGMAKSKIPVFNFHPAGGLPEDPPAAAATTKWKAPAFSFQLPVILADAQPRGPVPAASKKPCLSKPGEGDGSKANNPAGPESFRAAAQRLKKGADPGLKKISRRGYRPPSRNRPEESLTDKNRLLEAANQQLRLQLAETQGLLREVTEKKELLESFQDRCLAILESRSIDPVTGQQILEELKERTSCQAESASLMDSLMAELRLFNQTVAKQREEVKAAKANLAKAAEERTHFLEKQATFGSRMDDVTAVLEQMEQLLRL
ncbi:small kinetochore-associated protein [Ornithorhynchus anatinus]|nr:small kinetochore-associated protein [Ornithorhynchus anatinus]